MNGITRSMVLSGQCVIGLHSPVGPLEFWVRHKPGTEEKAPVWFVNLIRPDGYVYLRKLDPETGDLIKTKSCQGDDDCLPVVAIRSIIDKIWHPKKEG